jgi:hypothetical protein
VSVAALALVARTDSYTDEPLGDRCCSGATRAVGVGVGDSQPPAISVTLVSIGDAANRTEDSRCVLFP